jgi:magnesium chelatase family protein
MVQHVATVAFEGVEGRPVDVQVQVAPGLPAFNLVGLPDKAVSEAKERVRAALIASGLALPAKRITINMAPADLPKEGSHFDLPIALGLMAAIGAVPSDALAGFSVVGELGLDGSLAPVAGVLPAAVAANSLGLGLICPKACGPEAAWASPEMDILAPASLIQLANHLRGTQVLSRPEPKVRAPLQSSLDLADIRGQEAAKRALEIAAAGGHNLLFVGPAGAGKSMLAARLPTILPSLAPSELLEVSMIASVAGTIRAAPSPRGARFAIRITRRAWRRWWAAASVRGREKSRSPISGCFFSTSFRSFSRRCSTRSGSRSRAAKW